MVGKPEHGDDERGRLVYRAGEHYDGPNGDGKGDERSGFKQVGNGYADAVPTGWRHGNAGDKHALWIANTTVFGDRNEHLQ